MKTKLTLALLLFGLMLLLSVQRTQAQATSVNITYAFDSTWASCTAPPDTIDFYIGGMATGYNNATDPITIQILFGDGEDTTFQTGITPNGFWAYVTHVYTIPGLFSVQYIATGVDGNADTVTYYNAVAIGSSCGDISGKVFRDNNGNCIQEAGEPVIYGMPVNLLLNNQVMQTTWTDNNGNYYFSAASSFTYDIEIGTNYFGYNTGCPSSGSYTVSAFPSANNDFAMVCSNVSDLWTYANGWGFRPGFAGYITVDYGNASCAQISGQVQLTLDPLLTYTSATPAPSSVSGNVLTWNFTNLTNSNFYNYITVTVMTSLSANIGDTVCNLASITPLSGDANPANNTFMYCEDVRNSWDPNMKEVSPAEGPVAPNTTFTYTVHFQNTGTDVAYNIYVLDTLDSDLDAASLKIIGFSHPMTMSLLTGNVMKFDFSNIMLDDSTTNEPGSHGFVTYEVKAKPGLANGTQFTNTAHIYFDFNPAIVTNTTLNVIDIALGIADAESNGAISIWPNPANDVITLNFTGVEDNTGVVLVDMTGRVIASQMINAASAQMNVSAVPSGVYMINTRSANGNIQQRVIVVH